MLAVIKEGCVPFTALRPTSPASLPPPAPVLVRYLIKRGMGKRKSVMGMMSLNGLKNLKKRFIVLSQEGLSYHKEKGKMGGRLVAGQGKG
jgi:hypothetical protein